MVRRVSTPPPRYGSAAWLLLADGDVAKVAAVVIAAESWAREADTLEEDLRAEIAAGRREHKLIEDEEYVARAKAHRAEWARRSTGRTFLERRTEQLESVKPRPGDFRGRGA